MQRCERAARLQVELHNRPVVPNMGTLTRTKTHVQGPQIIRCIYCIFHLFFQSNIDWLLSLPQRLKKETKRGGKTSLISWTVFANECIAVRGCNSSQQSYGKARFVYEKPRYSRGGCYVVQSADSSKHAHTHTHTHRKAMKSSFTSKTETVLSSGYLQGPFQILICLQNQWYRNQFCCFCCCFFVCLLMFVFYLQSLHLDVWLPLHRMILVYRFTSRRACQSLNTAVLGYWVFTWKDERKTVRLRAWKPLSQQSKAPV